MFHLYESDDGRRFAVPDDHELPAGAFRLRSPTATLHVDEAAAVFFEVTDEMRGQRVDEAVDRVMESASRYVDGLPKTGEALFGRAPSSMMEDPDAASDGLAHLVAALRRVVDDGSQTDPSAVAQSIEDRLRALRDRLSSDDPETRRVVDETDEALDRALASATDTLLGIGRFFDDAAARVRALREPPPSETEE